MVFRVSDRCFVSVNSLEIGRFVFQQYLSTMLTMLHRIVGGGSATPIAPVMRCLTCMYVCVSGHVSEAGRCLASPLSSHHLTMSDRRLACLLPLSCLLLVGLLATAAGFQEDLVARHPNTTVGEYWTPPPTVSDPVTPAPASAPPPPPPSRRRCPPPRPMGSGRCDDADLQKH